MILSFHPCIDADMQIVLADRPIDAGIREAIRKADAIILPQACPQDLYEICLGSTAHVFPNYNTRTRYPGKIGQTRMFGELGVPHPKTWPWESVRQFEDACLERGDMPHPMPFLIKEDRRHEAEGVFLVEERKELTEALSHLARREKSNHGGFVTQEYISCGGNVLRAVIVGQRIITYWKRPNQPGQRITTISRGAVIDRDWRPDLQEKGRASTRDLMRKTGINLAAVDFVFSITESHPDPLFLEINYYFGRRGLGGMETYYRLLHEGIREWLAEIGMNGGSIRLI